MKDPPKSPKRYHVDKRHVANLIPSTKTRDATVIRGKPGGRNRNKNYSEMVSLKKKNSRFIFMFYFFIYFLYQQVLVKTKIKMEVSLGVPSPLGSCRSLSWCCPGRRWSHPA